MGEDTAGLWGISTATSQHCHAAAKLAGEVAEVTRRKRRGRRATPPPHQYLEAIRADWCWRKLHRLAARLGRVLRVQFEIKGMDRQQALCLAHLSMESARKENSA